MGRFVGWGWNEQKWSDFGVEAQLSAFEGDVARRVSHIEPHIRGPHFQLHHIQIDALIMATEKDQATGFSEGLPAPPPFWRHFSAQNIERLKEVKKAGEDIPEDLRALEPPEPPADGKYRSFGGLFVVWPAHPIVDM
jgi:hypothetical protein